MSDVDAGGRRTGPLAVAWVACTAIPVVALALGFFFLFDKHGATAIAVNIPGQLVALGLALSGRPHGRGWRLAAAVVVAAATFVVAGQLAGSTAL